MAAWTQRLEPLTSFLTGIGIRRIYHFPSFKCLTVAPSFSDELDHLGLTCRLTVRGNAGDFISDHDSNLQIVKRRSLSALGDMEEQHRKTLIATAYWVE